MKRMNDNFEKGLITSFIYFLLYVFKWLCLGMCVISAALTIGIIVLGLISGNDLSNAVLTKMMEYISGMAEADTLKYIMDVGTIKTIIAAAAYGFMTSLSYGIMYNLVCKFKVILDSIITGEMYTLDNVKLLNKAVPLALLLAFAPPVILYCTIESTGVFSHTDINVSGIIYLCVAYILKLLFEKGYEVSRNNLKMDKVLSDVKAQEAELKIETLKQQVELKELKREVALAKKEKEEKTVTKKAKEEKTPAKKITKKEVAIEEKKPVAKKTTKKVTEKKDEAKKTKVKKETTKKELTKKVTDKKAATKSTTKKTTTKTTKK